MRAYSLLAEPPALRRVSETVHWSTGVGRLQYSYIGDSALYSPDDHLVRAPFCHSIIVPPDPTLIVYVVGLCVN